jgi:hypothetical protein
MEDVFEKFIIEISDILVIMVGHLREVEQDFVMRLLSIIYNSKLNDKKKVIILHNIRDCSAID